MSPIDIRDHIASRYEALARRDQELFLVTLCNWLTLVARDAYSDRMDANRLRAVNEALHRILDQLHHSIASNTQRYPDDVFANILVDQFDMLGLDPTRILTSLDEIVRK